MKKLVLLLFSFTLFAQDYGNNAETLKLCTTIQTNSFSNNLDADSSLDRILEVVGLSKNFVLAPCNNINNAVAVSYRGVRYILYDPNFMSRLSKNTSNWSNLFILAHEIGHHVNGHSLDLLLYAGDIVDIPKLKKKREQELEADEFAGFVLAKLGASLAQTNLSVSNLSNNDDTYSTHPKRDSRLAAIEKGYHKGFRPLNNQNTNLNEEVVYKNYSKWDRLQFNRADFLIDRLNPKDKNPFKIQEINEWNPYKMTWSKIKGSNFNFKIIQSKNRLLNWKIGDIDWVSNDIHNLGFELILNNLNYNLVKLNKLKSQLKLTPNSSEQSHKIYIEAFIDNKYLGEFEGHLVFIYDYEGKKINSTDINAFKYYYYGPQNLDLFQQKDCTYNSNKLNYQEEKPFSIGIIWGFELWDKNKYLKNFDLLKSIKSGDNLFLKIDNHSYDVSERKHTIFDSPIILSINLNGSHEALSFKP